MSTNSTISLHLKSGSVKTIYCHWDGNYGKVGKTLKNNYSNEEKINGLLNLGNIESLSPKLYPSIGSKHSFDTPEHNVVVAYGRDRKEKNVDAKIFDNFDVARKAEYNYLFKDEKWFVQKGKNGELLLLTDELIKKN